MAGALLPPPRLPPGSFGRLGEAGTPCTTAAGWASGPRGLPQRSPTHLPHICHWSPDWQSPYGRSWAPFPSLLSLGRQKSKWPSADT